MSIASPGGRYLPVLPARKLALCACYSSGCSRGNHIFIACRLAPLPQSLAGGTGSGLGSALVTALRDEYGPSCSILSHAVWWVGCPAAASCKADGSGVPGFAM